MNLNPIFSNIKNKYRERYQVRSERRCGVGKRGQHVQRSAVHAGGEHLRFGGQRLQPGDHLGDQQSRDHL